MELFIKRTPSDIPHHLWYEDPLDDFVIQYNPQTRIMSNFWGTMSMTLGVDVDLNEAARLFAIYEQGMAGFLA